MNGGWTRWKHATDSSNWVACSLTTRMATLGRIRWDHWGHGHLGLALLFLHLVRDPTANSMWTDGVGRVDNCVPWLFDALIACFGDAKGPGKSTNLQRSAMSKSSNAHACLLSWENQCGHLHQPLIKHSKTTFLLGLGRPWPSQVAIDHACQRHSPHQLRCPPKRKWHTTTIPILWYCYWHSPPRAPAILGQPWCPVNKTPFTIGGITSTKPLVMLLKRNRRDSLNLKHDIVCVVQSPKIWSLSTYTSTDTYG